MAEFDGPPALSTSKEADKVDSGGEDPKTTRNIRVTQDFMEEVQKYPVLYDRFSSEFKNKYIKQNAWTSVGKAFGASAEEAEKRYKSIRTSYGRYLKKKRHMPTGSGRKDVPCISEFENLDWLNIYIDHRPTVTNINNEHESDVDTCDTDDNEQVLCISDKSGSDDIVANKMKAGEKRPWSKSNSKSKIDEALVKSIGSITKILEQHPNDVKKGQEDVTDEDELFCRSLVPQLKRLPPPLKQQAKIHIQQLLFSTEFHQQWPN
ncbi:PREDICTED: uncharacterized protein LOC100632937 [Amphimedon queenslandica]|uniref:MADF domain-containing protein n=1 Tax=Amphimedon queenslandica TaxID=400682 RepID=A0A1X7TM17_AMPQE|nr:PREDICTED: uncharacterized protein LOC100632937 [Amphimedon queenslandica]|eukprot:XP_003390248.1 PREDICTED: uncharacterized protein LOC100632937 [Amphimedon queenslandica]